MEEVLELQFNGVATPWSWASYNSSVNLMTSGINSIAALSLCMRVYLQFFRNVYTVFSMVTENNNSYLSLALFQNGIEITIDGQKLFSSAIVIPGYWHNICLLVNVQQSNVTLLIDEKHIVIPFNQTSGILSTAPVSLVFGQQQTSLKPVYKSDFSFHGKITHFNLWNRLLSSEELDLFSNCQLESTDHLLAWDPELLTLNGSSHIMEVDTQEVCRPPGVYTALLSPPLLYPVAKSICQLLRGNLSHVGDIDENPEADYKTLLALRTNYFGQIPEKFRETVKFIHEKEKWLSVQRLMKKGNSRNSKQKEKNHPSYDSKSVQKSKRSRYVRQTTEGEKPSETETLPEELSFSATCEFHEPPVFRIYGFCPDVEQVIEENYVVVSPKAEQPIFQGFTGKRINYSKGKWIADSSLTTSLQLRFEDPITNPAISPMGRHLWLILLTVDDNLLDEDVTLPCDAESLYLNLSPCPKWTFTCSDGTCLPLQVRCDRKADCMDSSDEDYCYKVDVPEENRNDLPPKPLDGDNIAIVELKVSILSAEIDFDSMRIHTEIWLTWKDPNLTMYNLQMDPLANFVDITSLLSIWVPTIEFGDINKSRIQVTNASEVVVLKENFGTYEEHEFSWEAISFKGSENSLQLKEKAVIDSRCTFNTFLFPFGMQKCVFPFVLTSALPDAVSLTSSGIHGGVSWEQACDDLRYDVYSIQFFTKDGMMYSTEELVFKHYPRIGLALLTMYFPSLFIVVIAISSFYLSLNQLQLRIGMSSLSLIGLLVLKIQAGSALTGRTGVKASDIWLFGADIIAFSIIISHVAIVKELRSRDETPTRTRQVGPMRMGPEKINNAPAPNYSSAFEKAATTSNKVKKWFIAVTTVLIIVYIILFSILAAVYKD